MRILQVIPSYFPAIRYGGPIFATHALSKALVARGHAVEVYTTGATGENGAPTPPGRQEMDGVVVHYFGTEWFRRLAWAPSLGRELGGEIGKFNVVHLQSVFLWPTWKGARLARSANRPYIVSPRGMLVKDLIRRRNRAVKSAWIALIEKSNLQHASAIHATSEREAQDLLRFGWTLPPIVTIPNGIEAETPAGAVSSDVSAATRDRPYALFLGRLSWKKGLDRLIHAFSRVGEGFLVIAGTDDEGLSRPLLKLSADLGIADRIHILARTVSGTDKQHLYRSARVFALPSHSENFGNTVLEAMRVGLPVVITPELGSAEIVAKAGGGAVVAAEPALFAAALDRFLRDHEFAKETGHAGERYVRQNCSWDAVASAMEILYRKVVSRRRVSPESIGQC